MSMSIAPHRSLCSHRHASGGVAIVELALIATVLLTLLLGIIEIGRALTEYKVLVNQVETAARYLATRPPGTGSSEARCLVTHGSTTCSGTLVLAGLASATVTVADSSGGSAELLRARSSTGTTDTVGVRMNLVRVTVSAYPFRILTGSVGAGLFGVARTQAGTPTVSFPDISSTQRQFAG